ncbi:MAG: HNH endonuclease signature motif containing protein [Pirellulaceae bacterium]
MADGEASLRRLVWKRANARCEYCHLPSNCDVMPFCVDHIIARKHGGPTVPENLALACTLCNSYKLDNLSGIDPQTGLITRLHQPRQDDWLRHFRWQSAELRGLSDIGRTTIEVLKINLGQRVEHRELLIVLNMFPQP